MHDAVNCGRCCQRTLEELIPAKNMSQELPTTARGSHRNGKQLRAALRRPIVSPIDFRLDMLCRPGRCAVMGLT